MSLYQIIVCMCLGGVRLPTSGVNVGHVQCICIHDVIHAHTHRRGKEVGGEALVGQRPFPSTRPFPPIAVAVNADQSVVVQ